MGTVPSEPPGATPREFLEQCPLYRRLNVGQWATPETISRDCATCEKETTWSRADSDNWLWGGIQSFGYQCSLCAKSTVVYLIRILPNGGVIKVGQQPPQYSKVPRSVEKRLGESADFYRRALTSQSQGYGLGAVAYFRRVVEDKTNELIDVVADAAAAYGVPDVEVKSLRAAKEQKVFEDKLKIAAQAVPLVLKPDGANPLQALYEILSISLHTQSEEECLRIAGEVKDIFEYLFDRLRSEIEDRTSFVTKLKKIVGGKAG
jgi:hypothetical protein